MVIQKLYKSALISAVVIPLWGCGSETSVTQVTTATQAPTTTQEPTATATQVPTATATQVPTATATQVPTATATQVPTATATQVPTATATQVPTATATQVPTATATQVPTATATQVPTATATQVPTATATQVPTATATQVPTATATQMPTPTATQVPTATATQVPTATATQMPTPTATQVPTPTATQVPTPTATQVPTATATQVPTATATQVPTATATQVPTPTATQVPTPTATQVPTPTATQVPTPTATKVPTPTATQVPTPTATQMPTPTATQVPTPTATQVPTPTATQVPTPTATQVPTPTATQVPTVTPTSVAYPEWVLGITDANIGEIYRFNNTCWKAVNDPGIWEAPSDTSWFWQAVDCHSTSTTLTPTPSVTPTMAISPTMTATPTTVITPTAVINPNLPNKLLITEIGAGYYTNSRIWFELYNGTQATINLQDYKFLSGARSLTTNSVSSSYTFNLPNQTLAAGEYILISRKVEYFVDSEQLLNIKQNNHTLNWSQSGFIELQDSASNSLDFVRFGGNLTAPSNNSEWDNNSAPTLYSSASESGGYSLRRDINLTDTNASSDWTLTAFPTPRGPNDVTCEIDNDADGIPDCSERAGSTFAGLDIYAWGARENQTDIFLEIDYMDSTDEGITPRKEALQAVKNAFAARNIALHMDVGSLYHSAAGISPNDFDLGGGNTVPFEYGIGLDPSTNTTVYELKSQYFDFARKPIFHYMIFGSTQDNAGASGSSGLAEVYGNDSLVSLGEWGLNSKTTTSLNLLINYQAGTLMHEFGHNLNLLHGGSDNVNNKPNYHSVMNYNYQLQGLSTIGDQEGDRYILSRFGNFSSCYNSLLNNSFSNYLDFKIDYSDGSSAPLNENNINENNGLGRTGSTPIDYNCNGVIESSISFDANNDTMNSTLNDYDDWGNLGLKFNYRYSGNEGASNPDANASVSTQKVFIQTISDEPTPPDSFFKWLKEINR